MEANSAIPAGGVSGVGLGSPGPSNLALNTLEGIMVFDTGLPTSGIVTRLYSVGFAGQDLKLGETRSGVQGKYSIS